MACSEVDPRFLQAGKYTREHWARKIPQNIIKSSHEVVIGSSTGTEKLLLKSRGAVDRNSDGKAPMWGP